MVLGWTEKSNLRPLSRLILLCLDLNSCQEFGILWGRPTKGKKQAELTSHLRALQIFINCLLIYSIFTLILLLALHIFSENRNWVIYFLITEIIERNKRKWHSGCLKMLSCHLLDFLGNDREERSQFTT